MIFMGVALARADQNNDQMYQCPGSNAHVWDKDQCRSIEEPFTFPGSGTGGGGGPSRSGGLLGTVRRILGL